MGFLWKDFGIFIMVMGLDSIIEYFVEKEFYFVIIICWVKYVRMKEDKNIDLRKV